MTSTMPAKTKKRPYLTAHNMGRKACAMMKVMNKLTAPTMLSPTYRISKGKVSLGTSHAKGPHDQAKPEINAYGN